MKLKACFLLLVITLSLLAVDEGVLHAQEIERVTGLILADGWQDVQANCTECHSTQLIVQNSGSKAVWESRIRWMQLKQ